MNTIAAGNTGSSVGLSIGNSTSGAISGSLSTNGILAGNQLQIGYGNSSITYDSQGYLTIEGADIYT